MRFTSPTKKNFRVYAVTGTHTVAFAIDCEEKEMNGLLGFAVQKKYKNKQGKEVNVPVMGFKVFHENHPDPQPGQLYSTYDNPIQSFTWEDFTVYPGQKYTYEFTPLYGTPKNLLRKSFFAVEVATEPDWLDEDNSHSVFFLIAVLLRARRTQ